MEPPIQLNTFRLEPDEWLKAMYTLRLGKQLIPVIVIVVIAAAVVTVTEPEKMPASAIVAVTFVLLILVARWSNMRKAYQNPLNRAMWSSRSVEFDEAEYRTANSDGIRSQIPFRTFVLVVEHKDYYLLYLMAGSIFPVPRSAFKHPQDEQAFRSILLQNNLLKPPKAP